jgi:hypothetical protein
LYYVTIDDINSHEWLLMTFRSRLYYNSAEWGDKQSWLRFFLTRNVASDRSQWLLNHWFLSYAFMPRLFVNLRQILVICAIKSNFSRITFCTTQPHRKLYNRLIMDITPRTCCCGHSDKWSFS